MGKKIILASPRGFCAGVDRAIETVEYALKIYGSPLYVRHEIVHNKFIVDYFKKKGVRFVEDISEIKEKGTVIFSAHGVSPRVWKDSEERNLEVIDATCPLVTKVHREAKKYAKKGYFILLIGHKKHAETEGTMGVAPDKTMIIESVRDAENVVVPNPSKVAYLTQTTLSIADSAQIIAVLEKRFPAIVGPKKSDICYATTNRQESVLELSRQAQMIIVIGSTNSSNSNRLKELAESQGVKTFLLDSASHLQEEWLQEVSVIGITAGASAPEILVKEVVDLLKKFGFNKIEELVLRTERTTFHLPQKILVQKKSLKDLKPDLSFR
jgi:4-hydroxy-3-methylbut-2-enyl diphosphate reductase